MSKEIWVRSADGERLLLCDRFYVIEDILYAGDDDIEQEYESHERAIEVLDKIQQFLTPKILVPQEPRVCGEDKAIFFCSERKFGKITELNNNGVFRLPKE